MLVVLACYCVLLDCESLIHVDLISLLFIIYVSYMFSFEWNKEVLDLFTAEKLF